MSTQNPTRWPFIPALVISGWAPSVLLVLVVLTVGCVDINGGAVELSWDIRQSQGGSCNCSVARIQSVQLQCENVDDPDLPCTQNRANFPQWPCSEGGATTEFEIPEGTWHFAISVTCQDGFLCNAQVPEAIVRSVEEGKVVQLNALAIIVDQCE